MPKSQNEFLLASSERLRDKAGPDFTFNLEPAAEVIPVFRTITQEVKNRPQGPNADVDDIRNMDIHAVPLTEVPIRTGAVSIENCGQSEVAAAERLKKNGPNILKQPKERYILKFLGFYFGGFCLLMWCAAAIIFLSYYPLPQMDGTIPSPYNLAVVIMILIVILFQGTFYSWQDWSSSSVMGKINGLLASAEHVIRGGAACNIPAENLVVGDIVELKLGSKVPADCVIFECSSDLAMERSILTGESIAVSATNRATDE
ncbi:ATPase Na K transporting alpha [Chytriomyces hyalinus]|nr:ATPase Na K transporting alpha [Chytriomyces hyalinus]